MLPVADIFGIHASLYGLFALCGLIAFSVIAFFRCRKYSIPLKKGALFGCYTIIALFIGAKLVGVLLSLLNEKYAGLQSDLYLRITNAPIVFYGGLLGALLSGYLYVKLRKLSFDKYFNAFTPAFVLFHAFGRIGCFFGGCCYGIPCSWGIAMAETPDVKRVPVQLIEAAFELLVFAVLILLDNKKRDKYNLAVLYLAMYAPFRFVIEFFRGDEIRGFFGYFSTSQWISIIILIVLIIGAAISLYKKSNYEQQHNICSCRNAE